MAPLSEAGTKASTVVHIEKCTSGNIRIMVPSVIFLFLTIDIFFTLKMSRMCTQSTIFNHIREY